MLCEECQKNEAAFSVTITSGGETTTRHLCGECMQKMEVSLTGGDISGFLTVETAFLFICPSLQQTITKGMLKKTTTSRIIITMRSACFFAFLPSPRFFIFYSSR